MIWIDPSLSILPTNRPLRDLFEYCMQLRGETFRSHKNRCTQKIRIGGEEYFLKQHHGTGWREIFRHLIQFRWPVTDAKREWRALCYLASLNIPVPEVCALGTKGINPANRRSFLLTRALPAHVSLEDLAGTPLPPKLKHRLIEKVAHLAGTFHHAGLNHRDLYLCHFLLERSSLLAGRDCTDPTVHVIDLHRADVRQKTPRRWIIKDLAALDFSSRTAGLSSADRLRFVRAWTRAFGCGQNAAFWKKVKQRGDRLWQKHGA